MSPNTSADSAPTAAAGELLATADELARRVARLRFAAPVAHVYNPLVYARAPYARYVERWAPARAEAVLLGMNPGPYGMTQTGVPFGEVSLVRDWIGAEAPVAPPARQHPRRPIQGFACARSEVSGRRLWGWARDAFETPTRFFARFFVLNYCPLVFLEESGRNRTPDKLPAAEREPLFAACDAALRRQVAALGPRIVVGVGAFAETRAAAALAGTPVAVGRIPHPSPASPAANRGWRGQAEAALTALGISLPV